MSDIVMTFDEILDCEEGVAFIPCPPDANEYDDWIAGVYRRWEPVSRSLTDDLAFTTWRRTREVER